MSCAAGECAYQTLGNPYCYWHEKKMLGLFDFQVAESPGIRPGQVCDTEQMELADMLKSLGAPASVIRTAFQKKEPPRRRVKLTVDV